MDTSTKQSQDDLIAAHCKEIAELEVKLLRAQNLVQGASTHGSLNNRDDEGPNEEGSYESTLNDGVMIT